jgi:hypothetical protein
MANLERCGSDLRRYALGRHRPIILLRKIDVIAQERLHLEQRFTQRCQAPGEAALELAQGRCRLRWCGCIDQIAHRLGLNQVELAVEHGSPGELARRCRARAGGVECGQDVAGDQEPAVT